MCVYFFVCVCLYALVSSLPACLPICLSFYLLVCLSVCLPTSLSPPLPHVFLYLLYVSGCSLCCLFPGVCIIISPGISLLLSVSGPYHHHSRPIFHFHKHRQPPQLKSQTCKLIHCSRRRGSYAKKRAPASSPRH